MLISELAQKTGVGKTTIRFYTKMELLPHGERTAGSRVYTEYPEAAVELVKNIKKSQAIGFTLTEIKTILADYQAGRVAPAQHRQLIEKKLHHIRAKQEELRELESAVEDMLVAFDAKQQ